MTSGRLRVESMFTDEAWSKLRWGEGVELEDGIRLVTAHCYGLAKWTGTTADLVFFGIVDHNGMYDAYAACGAIMPGRGIDVIRKRIRMEYMRLSDEERTGQLRATTS